MEMELKQLLKVFIKRWWIILLLPMLTGSLGYYKGVYKRVPVYEANTTLFVINKNLDPKIIDTYNEIMVGQSWVRDYSELIRSRIVTSTAIEELKLKNISPEELANQITVSAKNDTRIIQITVADTQAKRAKLISDKVAEVFTEKVVELFKVDNVNIIDKAQIPVNPVPSKTVQYMMIFTCMGLFAALGLIFLLEYLDDSIKTAEDVEKKLGLAVLGVIPVINTK